MVRIDPRSSKPIYEQITGGIKENIMKGLLKPGDKIPSIRELSKMLAANPNTVSKAYTELERQKVIETFTGKGTFVSSSYKPSKDEDRIVSLQKLIKNAVIESHYLGFNRQSFIELVDSIYDEIEKGAD